VSPEPDAGSLAGGGDGTPAGERAALLQRLRAAARVLLVLHVRPDGDSIGSTLAMAAALRRLGKEAVVIAPDPIPPNLAFLPGADGVLAPGATAGSFDVALFLDCAALDRIGAATADVARARTIVNVDHHPSNQRYGDLNYIEPNAAACGEVTYELIRDLGVALDAEMAVALYTAVVTDTGSFRYEQVSPRTHEIAADLLRHGVKAAEVAREVWENRSLGSLRLEAAALATLQQEGELAWLSVTPEMIAASGAAAHDTEGLVNLARTLAGVELALMFVAEGPEEVRVSLRSNRRVDVSALAAGFGGGGHARAAGCTLRAPLAAAQERVLAAARAALAAGR
jgi:phosphoesterase RecJ-like protein